MITTEIELPEPLFALVQCNLKQHPVLSFDDIVIEALCFYLAQQPQETPSRRHSPLLTLHSPSHD